MRVILAGYNVDSAVLDELKKNSPAREDVTPETLSASYARISRDPRPVDELRAAARAEVDRTRRSNQSIIFKMGHHSVAEHAVFNFDIIGVSRLAIEEIERFRLMSFTEKSQRYITLGEDFVVPDEVKRAGREALFVRTVKAQNALYHRLYARLKPFVFAKHRRGRRRPEERRRPRRLGQGGCPLCRQPGHGGPARPDGQRPQPRAPHPPLRGERAGRGQGPQRQALRAGQGGRAVHHPVHRAEPLRRRDLSGPGRGRRGLAGAAPRKASGNAGALNGASSWPEPPPTATRASSPPCSIRSPGFLTKTASRGPARPRRPPGRTSSAGPFRAWSSTISRPGNSSTPISFTTSSCRRRVSPSSSGTGWPP